MDLIEKESQIEIMSFAEKLVLISPHFTVFVEHVQQVSTPKRLTESIIINCLETVDM